MRSIRALGEHVIQCSHFTKEVQGFVQMQANPEAESRTQFPLQWPFSILLLASRSEIDLDIHKPTFLPFSMAFNLFIVM